MLISLMESFHPESLFGGTQASQSSKELEASQVMTGPERGKRHPIAQGRNRMWKAGENPRGVPGEAGAVGSGPGLVTGPDTLLVLSVSEVLFRGPSC